MKRKTIKDFEDQHGGTRIAQLETALKTAVGRTRKIDLELPSDSNTLTFGAIGDTHFGSMYEARDQCAALYRFFRASGVKDVLHAGDVLDGHMVYRGQEFEIHAHGWAAQRDNFALVAPREDGITTYFITGNHDASMKRAAGIDVGPELADRRKDWNFIGEDYANVEFVAKNGRRIRVALIHPDGGSAYSLSYRPQKITEQIEGGRKPNLLLIGHYHKAEFIPSYRNVAVMQTGTLCWQTPFMVRRGIAAHVGGWIIRITVHDDKAMANTINTEFTAFYRTKE